MGYHSTWYNLGYHNTWYFSVRGRFYVYLCLNLSEAGNRLCFIIGIRSKKYTRNGSDEEEGRSSLDVIKRVSSQTIFAGEFDDFWKYDSSFNNNNTYGVVGPDEVGKFPNL